MIRPFGPDDVWYIVLAAQWTIGLSAIAFAGGGALGLVVALARSSEIRSLVVPSMLFIRLMQGTPLLMQMFLCFFGLALLGIHTGALFAASLALVVHSAAFLGEIWRGSIQAVPHGQTEAARALGLRYAARMWLVVLPQAVRTALPPTVGFLVQLIKGTSLASIIGFVELTRAGQIVNNATFDPVKVFGLVAVIYFLLCWPLSLLADRLERRLDIGRRPVDKVAAGTQA